MIDFLPVVGGIEAQEQVGQDRHPKEHLLNEKPRRILFVRGSDGKVGTGDQGHDDLVDHPQMA